LWISPLILFVYLEPIAFRVIAGQGNPASFVDLAILAITLSLSVLIAAPGIELFLRANAKVIASLYVVRRTLKLRLQLASNKRRCKRLLKGILRLLDECLEQLNSMASIELTLTMAYDDDPERNRKLLKVAAGLRKEIQAKREQTQEYKRNLTRILQEIAQSTADMKSVNSEFLSKMSQELTKMGSIDGAPTE